MNRENWLQDRRIGIGGSDIATIMGLSEYQESTPLSVYMSKVDDYRVPETIAMKAGKVMESLVANEFEIATGFKIERPDSDSYELAGNPIIKGSYDYFCYNDNDEKCILECKNTKKYIINYNDTHYCQVQWYLGISGLNTAYIAYIDGGYKLQYFEIKRDDNLFQIMVKQAMEFWNNHIIPKIPPPPQTAWDIMQLYPKAETNSMVTVNDAIYDYYLQRKSMKLQISGLETDIEKIEVQIKEVFGTAELMIYNDKKLMTFKNQSRETIDTKALKENEPIIYNKYKRVSEFRVLR